MEATQPGIFYYGPDQLQVPFGNGNRYGLIGANGCGKSNIIDAVRWVMGETSAKSMRGSGMEDVIFAGASTRPARNFAEVSLGIDNTQRLAPAAFNKDDNLEIIRRITRDAGSAFKANGDDGFIVLHDGNMVFEQYYNGQNAGMQHLMFSVTKSFTGTMMLMLMEQSQNLEKRFLQKNQP